MCLCVYMYEQQSVFYVRFQKKKNRVGAICMGLMHGTAQCQQEQYNMVVKAMS